MIGIQPASELADLILSNWISYSYLSYHSLGKRNARDMT